MPKRHELSLTAKERRTYVGLQGDGELAAACRNA